MNKWKIGFWICFILLLTIVAIGFYSIIDQGVSLTYVKEGYSQTETDLKELIEIMNNTDLSKDQIRTLLLKNKELPVNIKEDTFHLNKISIFSGNKLSRIAEQW